MLSVLVLIYAFNAHTDGESHNICMATLLHRINIEQHVVEHIPNLQQGVTVP